MGLVRCYIAGWYSRVDVVDKNPDSTPEQSTQGQQNNPAYGVRYWQDHPYFYDKMFINIITIFLSKIIQQSKFRVELQR